MKMFTKDALMNLMQTHDDPCISIFIPTSRKGNESNQGRIRLKNAMDHIEEQLIAREMRKPDRESLLSPLNRLLEDTMFWQYQQDTLAIFINPNSFEWYTLPLETEEEVIVNSYYYIKPLLPLYNGIETFYILAVSQKNVALYRNDIYGIEPIETSELPKNLMDALMYDTPERHLQRNGGAGGYHGFGGISEHEKADLAQYLRKVDSGVRKLITEEAAPLIFAGVNYLGAIYKEVQTYPHFIPMTIEGNPKEYDKHALHQRAMEIIEPLNETHRQDAHKRYEDLLESRKALTSIDDIVSSAFYKKVDTLFIPKHANCWGNFDATTGDVKQHDVYNKDDEELYNFAAVYTILNGGHVYLIEGNQNEQEAVGAILRY